MASTTQEEIEWTFVGASGRMAERSSPYLIVGDAEEFSPSILAYGSRIGTDELFLELVDRERRLEHSLEKSPVPVQRERGKEELSTG